MLFPTISFALFFLVVATGWNLIPDRRQARAIFIAIASGVFYGTVSLPLLAYLLGWAVLLWAAGKSERVQGGPILVGGALMQLVFWKSFELLDSSVLPEPLTRWAVPLGVSFFTFQGLTYVFSRMKGELKEPWSLADVVAFVAFFPTVLSGPILRAARWDEQMATDPRARQAENTFSRALGWMCLGLFYKLVLSTLLGESVDAAWSEPAEQNPVSLWLAMYAYAFQLYTDFCGYSYLAAAVALLLGFEIPLNFNQPYLARSMQDFWRRWHVSLSTWLRDYLYIGLLRGNSQGKARQVENVMLTFLLCGAWHGFALHYLVWGLWQAVGVAYSTIARMLRPPRSQSSLALSDSAGMRAVQWFVTFNLVALGWVWFRAPDLATALEFFKALVGSGGKWQAEHSITLVLVLGAALAHLFEDSLAGFGDWLTRTPATVQLTVWAGLLVLVLAASPAGLPPFIYFKY